MGCVCKCVLDGEESTEFTSVVVRVKDTNEDEVAILHEDLRKTIAVSFVGTEVPKSSLKSGRRHTTCKTDASIREFTSPRSSQLSLFGPLREKLYASSVRKQSADASPVEYKFSDGTFMEGEVTVLRPGRTQHFVERWLRMTEAGLEVYKTHYHASKGVPLSRIPLKSIRTACAVKLSGRKCVRDFKYAFEVIGFEKTLEQGSEQDVEDKPLAKSQRILKSKTMPIHQEINGSSQFPDSLFSDLSLRGSEAGTELREVFCTKSAKQRNLWINSINNFV